MKRERQRLREEEEEEGDDENDGFSGSVRFPGVATGVRKLPPQARNSPRREVVRRFLTRDKILGSTLKRLSTPGPGYCFNVFESNIDASWARKPAWNETERKRREWRARGRGTRYRQRIERDRLRRDGTTHITSTGEHEKDRRRLAVTKEQEAKRNERKKNAPPLFQPASSRLALTTRQFSCTYEVETFNTGRSCHTLQDHTTVYMKITKGRWILSFSYESNF